IVLHGIEMLEDNAPDELVERIPALLAHPAPQVRARAIGIVRTRRLMEQLPQVEQLIRDEDAEVRVQAVSTYGTLSGGDPLTFLEPYLASEDVKLRTSAIYSIVEYTPAEGLGRARMMLEKLLASGVPETRRAAAEALGRLDGPSPLHELIGPLLR